MVADADAAAAKLCSLRPPQNPRGSYITSSGGGNGCGGGRKKKPEAGGGEGGAESPKKNHLNGSKILVDVLNYVVAGMKDPLVASSLLCRR